MRRLFYERRASALRMFQSWPGFVFGFVLLVAAVAGIDYIAASRTSDTAHALASMGYAAMLLAWGAGIGGVLWVVMRVLKGENGAPEAKDTMLWSACLVVIAVGAARMYQ